MKSNDGIRYQAKNRRQNKPDGKLFLVNRLCPGALLLADPIRSKACPLCHRDSFISAVFRVPEFTRQLNKLCRYGSGVAFLSLSQTKNGTNGISTFRTAETNVIFRTNELKIGAREDITQKGLWQSRGEGRTSVIDSLGVQSKELSKIPSPRFNHKKRFNGNAN